MIGRLRQCSYVRRLRGIKKFAVDKLQSATPARLSLLSKVEPVAGHFGDKAHLSKLFPCNITG